MPIFDPASSVAVVVTATGKVESVVDGLTRLRFDVTRKGLQTDLSNIETGESGAELAL